MDVVADRSVMSSSWFRSVTHAGKVLLLVVLLLLHWRMSKVFSYRPIFGQVLIPNKCASDLSVVDACSRSNYAPSDNFSGPKTCQNLLRVAYNTLLQAVPAYGVPEDFI